jgi:hypothetical protein
MEERVRSWLELGLFKESHKYNHHHTSLVIGPATFFLHKPKLVGEVGFDVSDVLN